MPKVEFSLIPDTAHKQKRKKVFNGYEGACVCRNLSSLSLSYFYYFHSIQWQLVLSRFQPVKQLTSFTVFYACSPAPGQQKQQYISAASWGKCIAITRDTRQILFPLDSKKHSCSCLCYQTPVVPRQCERCSFFPPVFSAPSPTCSFPWLCKPHR